MINKPIEVFRECIPLFNALSDPARQDIILLLAEVESLSVNEISEKSNLSRPTISHHLKIMKDNNLVTIEKKGKQRLYSLSLDQSIEQLKRLINIVESECIY